MEVAEAHALLRQRVDRSVPEPDDTLMGRGYTNTPDPDRPLRVGYCSQDFRNRSAGHFIEPIIEHHDKANFHVTLYHNVISEDEHKKQGAEVQKATDDHIKKVDDLLRRERDDALGADADGVDLDAGLLRQFRGLFGVAFLVLAVGDQDDGVGVAHLRAFERHVVEADAGADDGDLLRQDLRDRDGIEVLAPIDEARADLTGGDLADAALLRTNLGGAIFREADLRGAKLANATGDDVDFTSARFDGADLRQARLDGAQLDGAALVKVVATKVSLLRASLRNAELRAGNFRGAKLKGADLTGASLRDTDLRDADLEGARLDGADRTGTRLQGANLEGATGVEE